MQDGVRENLDLWQKWARINFGSEFYDVEGFKRGGVRVAALEQNELGDVSGKSLLHLQCHFGLDTLSWARLGARVTGVDFSEHAIERARQLAKTCGLEARFECCNLYDTAIGETFDVVYTSHGVLGWLPDLTAWARIIFEHLRPGGVFYLMEMHPLIWMMDEQTEQRAFDLKYRYFAEPEPVRFEYRGSYTDPDGDFTSVEHSWSHPVSDILGALLDAGLVLEFFHEFPFMKWKQLAFMEADGEGWFRLPADLPQLPLMFSLRAHRPA